ncbi:MAG: nucleotidyltransferase [Myxococcales bacterium]|nr:nucleotidyltransferase [Myxococcales bacterium]
MANAHIDDAVLLEKRLLEAAEELDVPRSMQEDAERAYSAVGEWLNRDDSKIAKYRPEIYPQGSFALGTAIKPLGDCDYDVDAVCELALGEGVVSQQELKQMVGQRLKEHGRYREMLDPKEGGRRCWTIRYADESKFHLDVLPAIPAEHERLLTLGVPPELARTALAITDQETWESGKPWPKTNPRGYAAWFKSRTVMRQRSGVVAITAGVERLPDADARTSLQRAVQLLKRHRDVRYGDDEDKPISIIITTLAAHAYGGEVGLEQTLRTIIPAMRTGIELRRGIPWVPNPVNPEENFADKWAESPRKQELFVQWLIEVERDLEGLARDPRPTLIEEYVRKAYDVRLPVRGPRAVPTSVVSSAPAPAPSRRTSALSRFDVPHRDAPPWPVRATHTVQVHGRVEKGGRWVGFMSGEGPLPKHHDLRFHATTTVPEPFDVFWQVVNTGTEATEKACLRGKILPAGFPSQAGLRLEERTAYRGHHWVECFIVRNGVCVARSGEFVVNIG